MRRDVLMEYVIVLPRISFWISEWELDCFWRETDAGEESSEPIYTVDWVGPCKLIKVIFVVAILCTFVAVITRKKNQNGRIVRRNQYTRQVMGKKT